MQEHFHSFYFLWREKRCKKIKKFNNAMAFTARKIP